MEPTYHSATDQRVEQSAIEQQIINRLQALGVPVVPSVKLGNNWVFDGACNGTKLLIEIHGDYWHTRPEVQARDARKADWAIDEGYQILTIWESVYQLHADKTLLHTIETYWSLRRGIEQAEAEAAKHAKHAGDRPRRADYGDWRDTFLDGLDERGILLDGCEAAGVSYETVRRHRREDADFDRAVRDARKAAADRLRRTYFKRADQQSDRAMEYMLRLLDPEEAPDATSLLDAILKYIDFSRLTDVQLDRLEAGDDPISVILSN